MMPRQQSVQGSPAVVAGGEQAGAIGRPLCAAQKVRVWRARRTCTSCIKTINMY